MQYLAVLYGEESPTDQPGTPEWGALLPAYIHFGEVNASAILGGEALYPSETATTVRADAGEAGKPLVTDGPFAETNEVIGGYYVLEAESLDEAIGLARQIPRAEDPTGGVELRPVVMLWAPDTPVEVPKGNTRYLATIQGPETGSDIPDTPEWDTGAAEHGRFIEKHAGALIGGLAVHPTSTATVVRVRDDELLVTDGPFTETNEIVGGAYVLHAATRDEAVGVAQDIPINPGGGIELRPLVDFD